MRVSGTVRPPSDKSLTHRALLLAALAEGESTIASPLTSLDAHSTAAALRALGVAVGDLKSPHGVRVRGVGLQGLQTPDGAIDCGNSGTSARLLLGVLAASPLRAELVGDASLSQRPMRRVTDPLRQMGAHFIERNGNGLPIVVEGRALQALEYLSPTGSAQVKSALLFAGLVAGVPVVVREARQSRDHTERMFRALGVPVASEGREVRLRPAGQLPSFDFRVPADPSSAAFLVGLACLAHEGELTLTEVGLNPTRVGFLNVITRMGGDVEVVGTGESLGEPVGQIITRPSTLHSTTVVAGEIPSLLDEIPLLAMLAARAVGTTRFEGVAELRVKESDRLHLLATNLRGLGVDAAATDDTLEVTGSNGDLAGVVETGLDHRMAMAFEILSRVSGGRIALSERESPQVSYPKFFIDLDAVVQQR